MTNTIVKYCPACGYKLFNMEEDYAEDCIYHQIRQCRNCNRVYSLGSYYARDNEINIKEISYYKGYSKNIYTM